ncbi:exopolyphosphatase / guanosine-5'-triphosphate,3'-diphosphate pyrophosphatase [Rhodoblastus acidophilus]|uniref:exopolyphosphatase n=1 Tax=Rhodoblastus acidophilus TaxID=1074 RepID=A0A212RUU8_RHOAC|nr:exopolyphosphatase [Rhodoblastus acidophilus]MCW2315341.1 exopolyphosphatase/guanosine-5'-triphosphate,3'-diphosphate pyrophosphatase [Rhodoblastus acidophilus]PPQ37328.1 exopolyphosphatase [Rhodoblastus acidophilus]RAI23114.1 exopolyphosphatase [Rhodoblastus acidophilus]SNB76331.1 exopolyphosphatase / guanosine-5'-triphosphate,3'-diphosphate pyrophosphatase [Rhodoblastus acidophilus]
MSQGQGRLPGVKPAAIVDIGSNSVRLVAYEGVTRSPSPIFNEKAMCGLGRGVATTGELAAESMDRALAALRRFRKLCDIMKIEDIRPIATAAARDAANGPAFLAAAGEAIGRPIELISGAREAELSALGVISTIHQADGVVGDLGGGSLELIDIKDGRPGPGVSLKLGALALMDASGASPKAAAKIARAALAEAAPLEGLRGRTFYAVGGTWRALAKLHMHQRNYPLGVMHGYEIPARDALDFATLVERVDCEALVAVGVVSQQRRPSLAYGAVALEEIIRRGKPARVVVSIGGVREGLLYNQLDAATRALDPLLEAARTYNLLRSRAPGHGEDMIHWTDAFFASSQLNETAEEKRLRHAACLYGDIGWRTSPDHRADFAMDLLANTPTMGVDHPGRAYLGMAVAYRHIGMEEDVNPLIRGLATPRLMDRARIMGALQRVAYIVSASTPGVLPRVKLTCARGELLLTLPPDLADLAGERLNGRLKQLARLLGRKPILAVA